MTKEYRVQRKDVKWGRGQGYYPIAKSAPSAKQIVSKRLKCKPSMLKAMKWKEGPGHNIRFTAQARKHLGRSKKR